MGATMPCRFTWVSVFISECATLLFYVVTGYKFRPAGETSYIALDKDDDDEIDVGIDGEPLEQI